jgi:hypothetical protein
MKSWNYFIFARCLINSFISNNFLISIQNFIRERIKVGKTGKKFGTVISTGNFSRVFRECKNNNNEKKLY